MARRRHGRPSVPQLWLGFVVTALGVAVWCPPDPATADPHAAGTPIAGNGCRAVSTAIVTSNTLRVCDQTRVDLVARPSCPACAGGVRMVFVQREVASDARWMNDEAVSALDEAQVLFGGVDLAAAVVHYRPGGARAVVPMTDRLSAVRSALTRPRSANDPPFANDAAAAAAREALGQLRSGVGGTDGPDPCMYVFLFAEAGTVPC